MPSRVTTISLHLFIFFAVVAMAVGSFLAGGWWTVRQQTQAAQAHPLLAKRIFIDNPSDSIINFEPLRAKLRKELEYYNGKVSLYFEYLPTGTSVRVGEAKPLVGASLLKLPYVMDLYHLAEAKQINLDQPISIKQEWLDDQYGDLYKQGVGYKLTIRQAAAYALQHSDNTALNAVKSVLAQHKQSPLESSFNVLDIDVAANADGLVELSARSYSSFLKCLYFACYVNQGDSQELLDYLSHSVVGGDRLPKYLPDNVPIAHKIGVVGEEIQNDCGIVYVPKRHYVLCVMLQESKQKGGEVIAQLSKYVYDYVTKTP